MIVDLTNIRMSDRFTCPIKVHPRSWSIRKPVHRFKVVLYYGDGEGRTSVHATRECAESSIRDFLEFELPGRWEIYEL